MTFGRGKEVRPWDTENRNKDAASSSKSKGDAERRANRAEKALAELQKKLDQTTSELLKSRAENENAIAEMQRMSEQSAQSCPQCAEAEAAQECRQDAEAEWQAANDQLRARCVEVETLGAEQLCLANQQTELLRDELLQAQALNQQLASEAEQAQSTAAELVQVQNELRLMRDKCRVLTSAAEKGRAVAEEGRAAEEERRAAKAQLNLLRSELEAARGHSSEQQSALEEGRAAHEQASALQAEIDRLCVVHHEALIECEKKHAREAEEGDAAKKQLKVELASAQALAQDECAKLTKAEQEAAATKDELSRFRREAESENSRQAESKQKVEVELEQVTQQLSQKQATLASVGEERDSVKVELAQMRNKHETELSTWREVELKHKAEQQQAAKEFDLELHSTQAEAAESSSRLKALSADHAQLEQALKLLQQALDESTQQCSAATSQAADGVALENQLKALEIQIAQTKDVANKYKMDADEANVTAEEIADDLAKCVKKNDQLGEAAEKLKKKLSAAQKCYEKEHEKVLVMERRSEVEKKFLVSEVKHSMAVAATQEKTAIALSKRLGQPMPPPKKSNPRSGSRIDAVSKAEDPTHLLCTEHDGAPEKDELELTDDKAFVAPPTTLPLSARASSSRASSSRNTTKKPGSSGSKRRSSITDAKNFSKTKAKQPDEIFTEFKLLSKLDKAKKQVVKHSAYGKQQR